MSARFERAACPLAGLLLLQRRPLSDDRGYFERMYCTGELGDVLGDRRLVHINHTLTGLRGTVRGMHFQHPPASEAKFVSCLRGRVFDVAVDLRRSSPTFLNWHAEILSADNHRTLFIPEGFAHGFQALEDDCEMLYFHTAAHMREAEGGVHPLDPRLAIAWPLPPCGLSPRDGGFPMLDDRFSGVSS